MSDIIPQLVKDLADACSTAVRVQNRYWLALAVASAFVLVPQTGSSSGAGLELPLGLPAVDASWFALVAVLVLSVLTTAFAAAQSRAARTQNLAYRIMKARQGESLVAGHDERDFFDALREPSLGQVASLAQTIRGRHQFFVDEPCCPPWRKSLSRAAYVFFKGPSLLVWLGFPATALTYALWRFSLVGTPVVMDQRIAFLLTVLVWLMAVAAGLALAAATLQELGYVGRVVDRTR